MLCEFGDWLRLTWQQDLLTEPALLLVEDCQFPQYFINCVFASAVCIPCSWPDGSRLLAPRSLSSERSLPCPSLLVLTILNRCSYPTLCSSSCSCGHRDTLASAFHSETASELTALQMLYLACHMQFSDLENKRDLSVLQTDSCG